MKKFIKSLLYLLLRFSVIAYRLLLRYTIGGFIFWQNYTFFVLPESFVWLIARNLYLLFLIGASYVGVSIKSSRMIVCTAIAIANGSSLC